MRKTKLDRTKPCKNDKCKNLAKAPRGMCWTCYNRETVANRRAAVAEGKRAPRLVPNTYSVDKHGYRMGYAPEHPLSSITGLITEHRIIAYEKYGEGEQECHWCKGKLTWKQVEVDHLDWNRKNNLPDNLVTSCKSCNVIRTEVRVETQNTTSAIAERMLALAKRLGR